MRAAARTFVIGVGMLCGAWSPVVPAWSAIIVVGNGGCTLDDAIQSANQDAAIGDCPAGSGADDVYLTKSVVLLAELTDVHSEITLHGGGYNIWRSVTASDFRIFFVDYSGDLTLDHVELAFGKASTGGGIYNRGRLTLRDVEVILNDATSSGGGIYNDVDSELSIVGSTISGNLVEGSDFVVGGGIHNRGSLDLSFSTVHLNRVQSTDLGGGGEGGGIYSNGRLVVTNSTISSNTAVGFGGGVKAGGQDGEAADFDLVNSSVSGNTAALGPGALWACGGGVFGSGRVVQTTFVGNESEYGAAVCAWAANLELHASLFADSTGGHCDGDVLRVGNGSFADDTTCLDIPGTLTGLELTLADNGGATKTHRLLPGSPAVDQAGDCGLGVDQRQVARRGLCDSGAFEAAREEGACEILEIADAAVYGPAPTVHDSDCGTAFLDGVFIDGPTGGFLTVNVLDLVVVMNGLLVQEGGELILGTGP